MSRRTERLSSVIRHELAEMILHDLDDPRLTGMPTITRVKVSEDLSMADVYVTSMGTPGQQSAALNALKHSGGIMRMRLTKALSTRIVPFLRFHADEQLRKELDMLSLLDRVHKENEELDRKRAEAAGEHVPAPDEQTPLPEGDAAALTGRRDVTDSDEGQRKEDSI
jgi:ribosome-binding factor A